MVHDLDMQPDLLASKADILYQTGNQEEAYKLYGQAAALTEAEILTAAGPKMKALLMCNAVLLWFKARQLHRSQELAYKYLAENPPVSARATLRDALQRCWQEESLPPQAHLIDLEVGLYGTAIYHGFAPVDEVTSRESATQSLLWRAAEHEMGLKPRLRGMPTDDNILSTAKLYAGIASAGSYKIRFKVIAQSGQLSIPGEPSLAASMSGEPLVQRAIDLIKLVTNGSEADIERAVPDPIYRTHFMKNVRDLAPDGDKVEMVSIGGGKTKWRSTSLTKNNKDSLRKAITGVYEKCGWRTIRGSLTGLDTTKTYLLATIDRSKTERYHVPINSEIGARLGALFHKKVLIVGQDEKTQGGASRFVVTHIEEDTDSVDADKT